MHFEPFRQLSNHGNRSAPFARLWVRYPAIPDGTGDVHFFVVEVLPKQTANLAIAQPHECGNCKRCTSGLGQPGEYALDLLQRIGLRFLRLGSHRVNCRIAGGILSVEIVQLLRQSENLAHDTLNVFQSIAYLS